MSSLATLCTEPNDQKSPRGNIEKTHRATEPQKSDTEYVQHTDKRNVHHQ